MAGPYRTVTRYEGDAVLEQMAQRRCDSPDILTQRRNGVVYPFGTLKQTKNQGTFLMRRLENVRGEFSLTSLTYNIKRALNLVGVAGLIAANGKEPTNNLNSSLNPPFLGLTSFHNGLGVFWHLKQRQSAKLRPQPDLSPLNRVSKRPA